MVTELRDRFDLSIVRSVAVRVIYEPAVFPYTIFLRTLQFGSQVAHHGTGNSKQMPSAMSEMLRSIRRYALQETSSQGMLCIRIGYRNISGSKRSSLTIVGNQARWPLNGEFVESNLLAYANRLEGR